MDSSCRAAMILTFDVHPQLQDEHDDWHSHEHLLERLAIAGFVRGSRWTALSGTPRYFVLYEVSDLAVLDSPGYLERLNHPSPWTARMMPAYRGMRRGLCRVVASVGHGIGGFALVLRFGAGGGQQGELRDWLRMSVLPRLRGRAGLVSASLFESGLQPPSTAEQRLRGTDASVDSLLLVTGYHREAVLGLADRELSSAAFEQRGATGASAGIYQLVHLLTLGDLPPNRPSAAEAVAS